ncbi:MAG: NAD(P)-binding domain-containing protein, partial [Bacteriovorax sp.]
YLDQFSKRHQLKILTSNKVISTEKTGEAFSIFASSGLYQSRLLVDCRGYFNFPFIPEYDITGEPPKMLHFKDYKNRAQLNDHKNILVVGKRLSAGQVLMELAVGKRHNLFLSARGPIHFSSRSFVLKHFLRHLNIYEGIGKIFARKIKKEIEVPMNHNAKHLLKKDVAVVGDISKIVDKEVYFKDGGHEHIDAIIFATGFRPHPIHLKDDFESAETEGLFYLGRGSQRTFTSRFIRGIREDAPVLSHLILGKLASSKRSQ